MDIRKNFKSKTLCSNEHAIKTSKWKSKKTGFAQKIERNPHTKRAFTNKPQITLHLQYPGTDVKNTSHENTYSPLFNLTE